MSELNTLNWIWPLPCSMAIKEDGGKAEKACFWVGCELAPAGEHTGNTHSLILMDM